MTYDGRTKEEKEKDRQREHELKLRLLDAFAKDPELKWYLGAALGMGVTAVSSLLTQPQEGGDEAPFNPSWGMLLGVGGVILEETMEQQLKETKAGVLPFGSWTTIAAGSFTGLCIMAIMTGRIFGTGGAAEILKGIGETVPG